MLSSFKKISLSLVFSIALLYSFSSEARDQIRIVGSSTVYPFATVAAEEFGTKTDFRTPIVESTGTGGGMKLFCSGVGESFPDITNASRKIKDSEVALCKANGIDNIIEVRIGYDGIAIANKTESTHYNLSKKDLFLAIAKKIPYQGKLVGNSYEKWSEINPDLPDTKIEVYGPPPTSGTRDAFVEIVLEDICMNMKEFQAAFPDEKIRKRQCHLIREDGRYIESGENDNLIVQKLKNNDNALGIFGFSFLEQNANDLQGSHIDGVEPTFENIASGDYTISRSLFMYVKQAHIEQIDGLAEFLQELTNEEAVGETGYLSLKGLIPLKEEERDQVRADIDAAINGNSAEEVNEEPSQEEVVAE